MFISHSPAHRASGNWFYVVTVAHTLIALCCRAALVVIDDFSPRIQYNTPVLPDTTCKLQRDNETCDGHWWFEHDDGRGSYENHTVHTTYGPGTTATLDFTGTSVALYGIVLQQYGAHAVATLDGASSSFDCNTTGLPDGSLLTKQQLFSKIGLDPSIPHKLVVAYDDATFDAANRAWMSIDYFEIDEQPLPVVVSQTVSAGDSTASTTLSSDTLSPVSVSSGKSPNVGAIVGGVIGGVALALAGICIVLLILRKRRKREQQRENGSVLSGADASSTTGQLFLAVQPDATTTPYIVPPAQAVPTATSATPSSFSGTGGSSLVPPPYASGGGAGVVGIISPSDANAATRRKR